MTTQYDRLTNARWAIDEAIDEINQAEWSAELCDIKDKLEELKMRLIKEHNK